MPYETFDNRLKAWVAWNHQAMLQALELSKRAGEPMPLVSASSDLDKPITLRQLKEAIDEVNTRDIKGLLVRAVDKMIADASTTDYVQISDNPGGVVRTYKIAAQPVRRVQVGDLVTVGASSMSPLPRVARVTRVNVPAPWKVTGLVAVAISPEDAARIEESLGRVPA